MQSLTYSVMTDICHHTVCKHVYILKNKNRIGRGIFVAFIAGMDRPVGMSYQESFHFLLFSKHQKKGKAHFSVHHLLHN